jgi:hypothetical protein
MTNICFLEDSNWVTCDSGAPPCARNAASCDESFSGLEVFFASTVANGMLWKNVTYTCLRDAVAMFSDAVGPRACDMYVGSLHPTGGAGDDIVSFSVPYFVGALYYVFPRESSARTVTGFEFLGPFSWSLWVAFLITILAIPVASAILEKDPKEPWNKGYLTFLADSWHAFWAVCTLDRDGASYLLRILGIAVALFSRVLMVVYSANITSYVLFKTTDQTIAPSFSVAYSTAELASIAAHVLGNGTVRAAERRDMLPGGSLSEDVLIVDEISLSSYVDCSRAYAPFADSIVPYSAAFPPSVKSRTEISLQRKVMSSVSTAAEMAFFEPPPYSSAACDPRGVSSVRAESVKYLFAAYAVVCTISIIVKMAHACFRLFFPKVRKDFV